MACSFYGSVSGVFLAATGREYAMVEWSVNQQAVYEDDRYGWPYLDRVLREIILQGDIKTSEPIPRYTVGALIIRHPEGGETRFDKPLVVTHSEARIRPCIAHLTSDLCGAARDFAFDVNPLGLSTCGARLDEVRENFLLLWARAYPGMACPFFPEAAAVPLPTPAPLVVQRDLTTDDLRAMLGGVDLADAPVIRFNSEGGFRAEPSRN